MLQKFKIFIAVAMAVVINCAHIGKNYERQFIYNLWTTPSVIVACWAELFVLTIDQPNKP